jgi:alkylation response protein AidB-like acyl-CoA dehydrogenase
VIDLAEDEDQLMIAETAAAVLNSQSPADLWKQCASLGWLALGLPEQEGGVGYGVTAQIVLFRELGRVLAPGPFLANSLAAHAALESGRADLGHELANGSVRAAWAEPAPGGRVRYWSDGVAPGCVLARGISGALRLVDAATLTTIESVSGVDSAYRLVTAEIGQAGALDPSLGGYLTTAAQVLTAAMLAGIAERTRDMSVQYAIDRVQYGKQIGSFQAVKHRCADMAVRAEAAWAVTSLAAVGLQESLPAAGFDATAALSVAGNAALVNARDNVQNHGAIGFTEEHSAQRYVKRSHVLISSFGTTAGRRESLLTAPSPW